MKTGRERAAVQSSAEASSSSRDNKMGEVIRGRGGEWKGWKAMTGALRGSFQKSSSAQLVVIRLC